MSTAFSQRRQCFDPYVRSWESPGPTAASLLSWKDIWGISVSGFPANRRYNLGTVKERPEGQDNVRMITNLPQAQEPGPAS